MKKNVKVKTESYKNVKIPFIPVEKNDHKLFIQGNSYVLTVPPSFAKSAKVLKDRRVRSYSLANSFLLYEYEKMCSTVEYDLLNVAFDCLFAVYHITENKDVQKIIEEVVNKLIIVQEHLSEPQTF